MHMRRQASRSTLSLLSVVRLYCTGFLSGALSVSLLVSLSLSLFVGFAAQAQGVPESIALFEQNCAVCHGENLQGTAQGAPLLGPLRHGDTMAEIVASISNGYLETGMPAWRDSLNQSQIRNIALYVLETRANINYRNFNHKEPLIIPAGVIESELHNFRLETIATGIDALPFSIASLPDGRMLVTEKKYGVRIIETTGEISDYIKGTPTAYSDITTVTLNGLGNERGWGWLFDIAVHPDYANNGWIYLLYGDRCENCNKVSRESGSVVSMNKLVRGRIRDGAWVDQETVWAADIEHYGTMIDVIAGGRIAFDNRGHVYFSVGAKGPNEYEGVQDLATPWGKIHRVNYDGSIPDDNPFVGRDGVYHSIYTLGHRSPQGLEFDNLTGELWGTEHGQRGGDEINHLIPARNYGWPLYSLGMSYDGTPVDYGKNLGIAFELADIQQPIVDLTPSPAVSSFVIADSKKFPRWRGNFLVGSLKARSLYRVEIENNRYVHRETLLEGLARIRDIEQSANGDIYLLLEHAEGGKILRLVPLD